MSAAVDFHGAPDDVRRPAEVALPERIAENRAPVLTGYFVLGGKRGAQARLHA